MDAAPPTSLNTIEARPEANGYLARLVLLLVTLGAGWLLNYFADGKPYFGFMVLGGVMLVCVGLVLGPSMQRTSTRVATPLFDLAWIDRNAI